MSFVGAPEMQAIDDYKERFVDGDASQITEVAQPTDELIARVEHGHAEGEATPLG